MLSRVAESIYWMNRYIERAENVARFIDVNLHLLLDLPEVFEGQWNALVEIGGDKEAFETRYDTADQQSVISFLVFDEENVNSIVSCVTAARENARSVREILSFETWEAINEFYLNLQRPNARDDAQRDPHEFFRQVRRASHLIEGTIAETVSRGEAWHFARMGRSVERADKTTRILDIKYFLLLPDLGHVGTPIDDLHWNAVLRSASALEMYRQVHGLINSTNIVRFLLLDKEFPRSVQFCLWDAARSVHRVTGTPERSFRNTAERTLGQLVSELDYTDEREIIQAGLHETLDDLQTKINNVGEAIFDSFFARRPMARLTRPTTLHEQ